MALQWSLYVGLLLLSAVPSVLIALLAGRRRDRAGAVPLAVTVTAVAIWSVAAGLQLAHEGVGAKLFWANLKYLGVVAVPAAWMLFALEYTGRIERVTWRTAALLSVEPLIVLALVWTNGSHHLFLAPPRTIAVDSVVVLVRPSATGFAIHVAYSYLLVFVGSIALAVEFLVSDHLYRGQMVALLAGTFVPWVGNALFLLGATPPGLDPTPIAFSVSGIWFAWALFRHDLFDVVPITREIARQELIESIGDAVVVVDERRRVADLNPSARDLLDWTVAESVGRPVGEVFPALASVFEDGSVVSRTHVTLEREGATRHYDVRVSPLSDRVSLGHLVVLRDVTERERHRQHLEVLNRVLRHDLRNDVNVVMALADEIAAEADEGSTVARNARRIGEKGADMIDLSEKARDLQRTLRREEVALARADLAAIVRERVEVARRSHPEVEIHADLPERAPVYASELLESAVVNVIGNAIEHNDSRSPELWVSVAPDGDGTVTLEVADNGPGIPEQEREVLLPDSETSLGDGSGLGLWIVDWIVTESGGRLEFEENRPRGTVVRIELPADEVESGGAHEPRSHP